MKEVLIPLILSIFLFPKLSHAQDNTGATANITSFPNKYVSEIDRNTITINSKLSSSTISYLKKLEKQESKLKKGIAKLDSSASARLFPTNCGVQYEVFMHRLKSDSIYSKFASSGIYYPNTDSLQMILSYLKLNPKILSQNNISPQQLQSVIDKFSNLQGKLNYSDYVNEFIAQRKQQFQAYLSKYSTLPGKLKNSFSNYSKEAAFYKDQIKSYKEKLNDPDKMMSLALSLLYKLPAFNDFIKSNSVLSGLFGQPANVDSSKVIQGLQTRKQIQTMLDEKMGAQGPKAFSSIQTSVQSAQGVVDGLRSKINASGSDDLTNPDFQNGGRRNKSFLHRIEYGMNLQTNRSTTFFPITTEFAFSAGYKINKSNVAGLSIAYLVGWGSDIHHIHVSSQGIGLRSFIDLKLKKTFFVSGGLEYNYQQPFDPMHIFSEGFDSWTKSGLIGISKIVQLKSKVLKKSKVQLLWDFLSYYQIPVAQPFVFRVGYVF